MPSWNMVSGALGGAPDPITQMYKALVGGKRLQSYAVDQHYTATTTLTGSILVARNITIDTGVTVTVAPVGQNNPVVICDTLTVNGVLTGGTYASGGAGSYGNGAGGNGGKGVTIFARQIQGTGSIIADGQNGSNGAASTANTTMYSGTQGSSGYMAYGSISNYGGAGPAVTSGMTAAVGANPGTIGTGAELLLRFPTWMLGGPSSFSTSSYGLNTNYNYGGGGGSGGSCGASYATACAAGGGAGGGSAIAQGGNGGIMASYSASNGCTGGGGGGGAGTIYIFTEMPFPSTITLSAKGGNGGNGYGSYGGSGGGGAGGYIGLWCPSGGPATTNVAGGLPGSQTGGTGGTAGSAGDFDQFTFAA